MRACSLFLICGGLLAGCSTIKDRGELPDPPEIRNHKVGAWTNVHQGDPDLLGVRVQQFPDCPHDAPRYENRHPAMIIYLFKDRRYHRMGFAPDGKIQADFWRNNAPDWLIETLEKPKDGT